MESREDKIRRGRRFAWEFESGEDFTSDQIEHKPQPPLVKAPMGGARTALPMNFSDLPLKNDILSVIYGRESHRVYAGEPMSLLQLSFLLWATQGIKGIRGKNYATLRTVPCGGCRHEYETYLLVRDVSGLTPGAYHYLPMSRELEYLGPAPAGAAGKVLMGQRWADQANAVFFWAMVPYRCEWRYSVNAHRPALIDAGHIGQNLYLACEAAGLGGCGVAAFDMLGCSGLFGLNPEEEFVTYTMPVGTVKPSDKKAEQDFYAFVAAEPGAEDVVE